MTIQSVIGIPLDSIPVQEERLSSICFSCHYYGSLDIRVVAGYHLQSKILVYLLIETKKIDSLQTIVFCL